jgi:hypothetical protein
MKRKNHSGAAKPKKFTIQKQEIGLLMGQEKRANKGLKWAWALNFCHKLEIGPTMGQREIFLLSLSLFFPLFYFYFLFLFLFVELTITITT